MVDGDVPIVVVVVGVVPRDRFDCGLILNEEICVVDGSLLLSKALLLLRYGGDN